MLTKNIIWDFFGKISNQIISIIISVILSRLLLPEVFGELGVIIALVSIVQIFASLGFGSSLIYEKNITSSQLATIFYINLFMGVALSLFAFFFAPYIAFFYKHNELINYLRWICPLFILNSVIVVPNALIAKELLFKKCAIFSIYTNIISGSISIFLAFSGWGIYSLIAQQLIQGVLNIIVVFVISRWNPTTEFSILGIKHLWLYTRPLFFSGILDTIFSKVDSLIIGKLFSFSTLGLYTRTLSLNSLIVQYSSSSLSAVFFPYLNKNKEDVVLVRETYYKFLSIVSFLAFGLIILLYPLSSLIFNFLFGMQWNESSNYFRVVVFSSYAYPLSAIMVSVLLIKGATKQFLKLEIIKKITIATAYLIGFSIGIYGYLWAMNVAYLLAVIFNVYFVHQQIKSPMWHSFKIISMYMFCCIFIVLILEYLFKFTGLNKNINAFFQTTLSLILYISFVYFNKAQGFIVLLDKLKTYFK